MPHSNLGSLFGRFWLGALGAPCVLGVLVASGSAGSAGCGGATPRSVTAPGALIAAVPVAVAASGSTEDDAGVPIHATDPTWGDRLAPVTIVEFADFECAFCVRAEPTLKQVRDTYGPKTVRFVWKDSPLPFHAQAHPAAEAAEGVLEVAGVDAFWRFHDLAFARSGELSEDAYVTWAGQAGVGDLIRFRAGLRGRSWAPAVDADLADAKALGIHGTPSFLVNGVSVVGAQPFDEFKRVVDAQIASAQAKVAAGVAPDRVYAVLSKENRAAQPKDTDDEDDEPKEDRTTVFRVPVGSSPVRGPATAPVTLVEFADFQCPFCLRVEPTLAELRSDYGDKLRIVFRNEPLPFHKRAEPAAEAALEVRAEKGDAAFWTMHDALLDHAQDLDDASLVKLATAQGAQADKVLAAITKHTHQVELDADADVADDFLANGTPHFFINGRRLAGAQPKADFAAIIDEELAKARALIAAGTKPEGVYDALTKEGKTPPPPEQVDVAAIPAGDPARGPATAKITIHEFADFQCPYCVHAEPTLKAVAKAYGAKVRFVWHDLPLPFHENALPAARTAREALTEKGDGAFWDLHDRFFAEGAKLERADLETAARALHLDMTKWAAALDGDGYKTEFDRDKKAADDLGFRGTPSFVITAAGDKTGYTIVGAQGYPKFRKLIDRALAGTKK